jgi:lysophospholipase L1-like esterase
VAPPPILETGCLAEMFAGGAAKSQHLGPAIKAMTARMQAAFFDAGQHIAVSPVDGIHYDAEAQVTLGRALAETLRPLLA